MQRMKATVSASKLGEPWVTPGVDTDASSTVSSSFTDAETDAMDDTDGEYA
jgi:hypothetical protein